MFKFTKAFKFGKMRKMLADEDGGAALSGLLDG